MKGVLEMKKAYEAPSIMKTEFESYDFITISIPDLAMDGIEDNGNVG